MESIADSLKKRGDFSAQFESLTREVLENAEVAAFIKEHELSNDAIARSYSKFYEYVTEKREDKRKGYLPVLVLNEGFADVAYQETDSLRTQLAAADKDRRTQIIGLSDKLKSVRFEDIRPMTQSQLTIKNQLEAFFPASGADSLSPPLSENDQTDKLLSDSKGHRQGLYIYGSFGVGKTYMMAALVNQAAFQGFSAALVHYPSFVASIDFNSAYEAVNRLKTKDLLVLDDIGAESNNAWLRDSVLQVLLQYRMDHDLLTFFTSNFRLAELEARLAETKNQEDSWAAARVMERVRYLATEIKMTGDNRRHE